MSKVILNNESPSIIYLSKKDSKMAYLIKKIGDLSYETYDDGYSFIIHEIIEQMLSAKAGRKIFERLNILCGQITPQKIYALTDEQIKSIGTSYAKVKYIKEITLKIIQQELILADLTYLSNNEIIKKLTSIKGIGNWTAKMYLIFVLNREDVIPTEDVAFIQGYKWLYNTKKITKNDIEKRAKKWGSYASIAARYLYIALDTGLTKQGGIHMNDGFVNEQELREYINSKRFEEYNENIKNFLRFTFSFDGSATGNFVATKCPGGQVKPDLIIEYKGMKKYISIKKGSGNSVHQEKIDVFFPFIIGLFGQPYLDYLKKFHYGDGTIDDSGIERFSASECQNLYRNEISQLNAKFNEWYYLKKFLDRFLFLGNVSSSLYVDIVYHGTITSGLWATKDEIYDYFKQKEFCSNTLHFGSLTYQVWGRNNDFTAVHPDRRYVMQVKWGNITNDLKFIRGEE